MGPHYSIVSIELWGCFHMTFFSRPKLSAALTTMPQFETPTCGSAGLWSRGPSASSRAGTDPSLSVSLQEPTAREQCRWRERGEA